MVQEIRNLFPPLLLLIGNFATTGVFGTSSCKSLSPEHTFNHLNETLRRCYLPLIFQSQAPSCEIGNKDLNKYPRCVNNAECIKNPRPRKDSPHGVCVCEKDYKMTSAFTCDPILGENDSCQFWVADSMGSGPAWQADNCDTSMGLRCSDGICQCQETTVNGVCILGSNQMCRFNQTGRKSTARCEENAHCAQGVNYPDFGVCTCDEGFGGRGRGCPKILEFGENCEEYNGAVCDENAGLRCRSGTCQCDITNPDSEQICNIRIGARCKSESNVTSCPRNASCSSGECRCNEGFVKDTSGVECRLVRQRGETCDDNSRSSFTKCDSTSGLTCKNGRCECTRELSLDRKSCIIDAMDECSINDSRAHCTPNSVCKRSEYSDSNSNAGTCTCHEGFATSWHDRKCHKVLGKGEKCTPGRNAVQDFCNKEFGLTCSNFVCNCENGEIDGGKCKLKIGNSCKPGGIYPNCPANAKCESGGECTCNPGFVATNDKSGCSPERRYMEVCGEQEGICFNSLSCIGRRCQCSEPEKHIFDPDSNACKRKGDCERDSQCPSKSSCQQLYTWSSTKFCKCNEGYSPNYQSLCKSDYMTTCSKTTDCLTAKSMACINGVCRCSSPMNQIYNTKINECVGLVGSKCGTENKKCMESSFCGSDDVCKCAIGYITTEDGKCAKFLNLGANCTDRDKSGDCNWSKGMACVNNICACLDPNLEYLEDDGSCVGRRGSICGINIPVEKCVNEKVEPFNFPACKYFTIPCGKGTSCKKWERDGVLRCLAS